MNTMKGSNRTELAKRRNVLEYLEKIMDENQVRPKVLFFLSPFILYVLFRAVFILGPQNAQLSIYPNLPIKNCIQTY